MQSLNQINSDQKLKAKQIALLYLALSLENKASKKIQIARVIVIVIVTLIVNLENI